MANADGVLAGRAEGVALDDTGREQAKGLADALASLEIAAAYTSPVQRCRETAAAAGLEPDVDPAFTECDYGEWTNRSLVELGVEPLWKEIQTTPSSVRFPGGESMAAMQQRVVAGIDALHQRHGADEVVVVFSHGDPIKAALAHLLGVPFDEFQRIHVAPASVSIAVTATEGSRPLVVCVNGNAGSLRHVATSGPALGGGDVAPGSTS